MNHARGISRGGEGAVLKSNHIKAVAATAMLLVAGGALYWQLKPAPRGQPPQAEWYYDLNTGKLFTARIESPPIDAPSGKLPDGKPAGVRAHVYSCGRCDLEADRQVAWLETFEGKAGGPSWGADGKRKPATPPGAAGSASAATGSLVKTPDLKTWVSNGSEDGRKLQVIPDCKDGSKAKRCVSPPPAP